MDFHIVKTKDIKMLIVTEDKSEGGSSRQGGFDLMLFCTLSQRRKGWKKQLAALYEPNTERTQLSMAFLFQHMLSSTRTLENDKL